MSEMIENALKAAVWPEVKVDADDEYVLTFEYSSPDDRMTIESASRVLARQLSFGGSR